MTAKVLFRVCRAFFLERRYILGHVRHCSASAHKLRPSDKYDVIITGGGMVGSTMAAALACEPCFECSKILLLETAKEKKYQLPAVHSNRVVAISPASVQLMKSIGAWGYIEKHRHQPVKKMQVWEECAESVITFQRPRMETELAHIVENDLIQAAVMDRLLQYDGKQADIWYKTKVEGYQFHEDGVDVLLSDGKSVQASLVIGADGHNSLLRRTLGFHTVAWDYSQRAVVAVLQLSEDTENNVAWQRFLKTGPIAMLPLSSEYSCLIWTNTVENVKHLLKLPSDAFVDAVNNAFWSSQQKDPMSTNLNQMYENVLSTFGVGFKEQLQLPPTVIDIAENSRASFPLGLSHSSKYVGKRVALVGDSAHRIHPLAGQGVNLGFGDVISLKEQLVKWQQLGGDLGSGHHLLDYESQRQRKVIPTMAAIDGLNKLYSTGFTPVVALRSLGLQTTNAVAPLKDLIMKFAMS